MISVLFHQTQLTLYNLKIANEILIFTYREFKLLSYVLKLVNIYNFWVNLIMRVSMSVSTGSASAGTQQSFPGRCRRQRLCGWRTSAEWGLSNSSHNACINQDLHHCGYTSVVVTTISVTTIFECWYYSPNKHLWSILVANRDVPMPPPLGSTVASMPSPSSRSAGSWL